MIVDASAFVGDWPYWRLPRAGAEGLLATLDRWDIALAVVSSTRALLLDGPSGNSELLDLARQPPDRVMPVATVNPAAGSVAVADAETCLAAGARGIRLAPAFHGYGLEPNPHLDAVVRLARDAGRPVLLTVRAIMNWGFPHLPAAAAASLLARHRGLRLVLCGVNRVDFDAAVDLARSAEVYVETSCLQEFGAVAATVERIGAERVLFGTGLPLQYAAPGIAKVRRAHLSEEDRARVLGTTAIALFGAGGD